MGSSDNAPTQTPVQSTTATREPWAPSQPFLQQALNSSAGVFNQGESGQLHPYTGQTMADVHPWQQQGQQAAFSLASSEPNGSAALGDVRSLADMMVKSQGLTPQLQALLQQQQGQNNPYLQGAIDQQVNKVNSAMSGGGRYGSGVHDAAITSASAPILAQDYAQRQQMQKDILEGGLQRSGQWGQLIPSMDEARFANSGRMMDLGQFYSNRAQGQLNSDIEKYNAQQSFPWENLARYNAIASGAGGLGGTTVGGVSGYVQQPTTMQKLFGGAAAGAGLGGSFGGPAGAGVGAGIGGLLGLL